MVFQSDLDELKAYQQEILNKFLSQYIPVDPTHTPETFKYDVSSYILHFHAAIEDYIERIARNSITIAQNNWLSDQKFSKVLLSICINRCEKITLDNHSDRSKKIKDLLNSEIIKQVELYKKSIDANHGIGMSYLEKIFVPVGIDILVDVNLENSLKKIADFRGEFAHKRPSRPLAPEDAIKYSEDCLSYIEEISKNANAALSL